MDDIKNTEERCCGIKCKCKDWCKKNFKKEFVFYFILILGSLLIFSGLYSFAFQQGRDSFLEQQTLIQDNRYPTNTSVAKNIKIDANLFGEVLKTLASRFYGKDTLDGEKLMEGAIKGMVDSLEDPFSEFLNAKDMAELDKELSGSFEGIGAEVGKKDGRIVIIAPLANTPAQRAGIQPQDEIVQINGTSTYNMTTNDVVMKIRGKKGTSVKLLIMRKSFSQPKEFIIVRDTINIPSASVEMLPSGVALLKIYNFYQPLSVQFARSLKTIQDNKAKGLIIDLRNNPGGYLDIYTEIGNYFFNKESLLLIEDYKGFVAKKEYTSKRDGELKDMPIIVLINGGTASASEILAGSLRDNRGIKLVGENSFGKGSVQELISLSGNNQLKLTIAHWLTPKGTDIHKTGLKPDFIIEPSKAMLNSASYGTSSLDIDNQLKKAYDELIKIIK